MTTPPSLSYLICTTPRTGSTLLASGLAKTGVAGRPAEYFDIHDHNDEYWTKKLGIGERAEYVSKVKLAGTTANHVFGLKLHWHQTPACREKLLLAQKGGRGRVGHESLDSLLRQAFGPLRYLWLRRRNRVAQGISYYRAGRTGVWRAFKGRGDQEGVLDQALEFDFDEIDRHVRAEEEADWRWTEYFREGNLNPLMIVYEDMVENYDFTIRGVMKFLGLLYEEIDISPPEFERQADQRSLEWERLYREIVAQRTPDRKGLDEPMIMDTRGRGSPAQGAAAPQAPPTGDDAAAAAPDEGPLDLVAYAVNPDPRVSIVVGPPGRAWMDKTPSRFAYRCLPMLIANQWGWLLLNPRRIEVVWSGGEGLDALTIAGEPGGSVGQASSHFGAGILTFTIPYLFRTPPGFNLYVRGPSNAPKDGVGALEGIVETDWSEATFTMNWKVTRPNHPIIFEEGEPIAMITPVRRGELERFRPVVRTFEGVPDLEMGYMMWAKSRADFNLALGSGKALSGENIWQKHYFRGTNLVDIGSSDHQTKLYNRDFVNKDT